MNDDEIKKSLEEIKKELWNRIEDYPGIIMLGVYNKQDNLVRQLLEYY